MLKEHKKDHKKKEFSEWIGNALEGYDDRIAKICMTKIYR